LSGVRGLQAFLDTLRSLEQVLGALNAGNLFGGGPPGLKKVTPFNFPADTQTQNVLNQAHLGQGMNILNSIFFGGGYGQGPANNYKLGQQYYDAKGNPVKTDTHSAAWQQWAGLNPMLSSQQLQQQYGDIQAKAGNLFTGHGTSQGFTPDFYNKIQSDYTNFAMPQLAQQYNATNQALQYKLGNQGLFGSSAQRDLETKLGQELATQKINIVTSEGHGFSYPAFSM
jgi:hypothetical protein